MTFAGTTTSNARVFALPYGLRTASLSTYTNPQDVNKLVAPLSGYITHAYIVRATITATTTVGIHLNTTVNTPTYSCPITLLSKELFRFEKRAPVVQGDTIAISISNSTPNTSSGATLITLLLTGISE